MTTNPDERIEARLADAAMGEAHKPFGENKWRRFYIEDITALRARVGELEADVAHWKGLANLAGLGLDGPPPSGVTIASFVGGDGRTHMVSGGGGGGSDEAAAREGGKEK